MERPAVAKGSIARAIRLMRVARGLSQIEVAAAIGRTRQTVRSYEREPDGVTPPPDVLAALAELFGVPPAMLGEGLVPESIGRDAGLREQVVREQAADHYGLGREDLARQPGASTGLLQMPDHVLGLVSPFLGEMMRARVAKEARDRAEAWLTELACGVFTAGHPSPSEEVDVADAQDAIAFLRSVYARRGVTITLPPLDLTETPDPDAVSGEDYLRSLHHGKRKPKAG